MSFDNKVVLVTGASSGIGAAIALKFAESGANLAIVGRNKDTLKNVCENIAKVGKKPLVIVTDVTKENDAQRIINDTLKQFGKLNVLVNNASVGAKVDIIDENAMKVFDHVMATNLRSAVPGPVKTDIIENMGYTREMVAATWEQLTQAAWEQIAELALFLASDKAVGIIGSTYVNDNGYLLVGH
ncbi:hypothetical protein ABMA28_005112 [Loxostege sticticalis]|uniref:Uncharacterized protein n=1 Tax=Loxostege sticticalis TaxID=481309 RepID=A0ABD0SQ32_LOXSC